MKRQTKFIALIFFFGITFFINVKAQQQHFIYIQADSSKQFTATVNNQTYSSSAVGYVIISKLIDGQYTITINFSDGSYPQQNFSCTIDKKDLGFQLKNFGAKGWGLFNNQTLDVIMSGAAPQSPQQPGANADVQKKNAFGEMLGDVVDDTTLNKPVASSQAVTTTLAQISNDRLPSSTAVQNVSNDVAQTTQKNSQSSQSTTEEELTTSTDANTKGIIKASEESTEEGTKAVFVDFNSKGSDTINIFIPAVADNSSTQGQQTQVVQNTVTTVSSNVPSFQNDISVNTSKDTNTARTSNPFYKSNTVSLSNNAVSSSTNVTSTSPGLTKYDCSKMATDEDLEKTRKKMLKETGASEMTVAAKKTLVGKCVTTAQVKTMGNLFTSDDARYNFYEAMYNFTYDYGSYSSLESQLIDPYYKKRFDALLK